jgi:hypothetical protein
MIRFGRSRFGIRRYDLRAVNGIRWWRLEFAPFDFLIDPGIWIRDTRISPPDQHRIDLDRGFPIGHYRVKLSGPQLYFDHGTPEWAQRLAARFRRPSP